MCIEGAPVLQMFDDATRFSAAEFVEPLTTKSVWETILTFRANVYTGFLNTLVFDGSSQFRDFFLEICKILDVKWRRFGKQQQSALGKGEKYYEQVRRPFRKLRIDNLKLKKEFLRSLAVKACNDTLVPEGVVPSALVFGELPSLYSFLRTKAL